jgi:hypothetical protein
MTKLLRLLWSLVIISIFLFISYCRGEEEQQYKTLESTFPLAYYYKFDASDFSGSRVYNYATSNYDANLVNDGRSDTVSSVAGGGSLSLSGSGFVSLPDFTSTPEGLTLAFWIRTPAYLTAPDQVVVEFGRNDYYNGDLMLLWEMLTRISF